MVTKIQNPFNLDDKVWIVSDYFGKITIDEHVITKIERRGVIDDIYVVITVDKTSNEYNYSTVNKEFVDRFIFDSYELAKDWYNNYIKNKINKLKEDIELLENKKIL